MLGIVWRTKSAHLFGGLGRMLLKRSDEPNAIIAFQQVISHENGIMDFMNIRCDGCGLPITCAMGRASFAETVQIVTLAENVSQSTRPV